jgi:hypothetical protein
MITDLRIRMRVGTRTCLRSESVEAIKGAMRDLCKAHPMTNPKRSRPWERTAEIKKAEADRDAEFAQLSAGTGTGRKRRKVDKEFTKKWRSTLTKLRQQAHNNWWLRKVSELNEHSRAKREAEVTRVLNSIDVRNSVGARQPQVIWAPEDDGTAALLRGGDEVVVRQWHKKFTAEMSATPQERQRQGWARPLDERRFLDVLTRTEFDKAVQCVKSGRAAGHRGGASGGWSRKGSRCWMGTGIRCRRGSWLAGGQQSGGCGREGRRRGGGGKSPVRS